MTHFFRELIYFLSVFVINGPKLLIRYAENTWSLYAEGTGYLFTGLVLLLWILLAISGEVADET